MTMMTNRLPPRLGAALLASGVIAFAATTAGLKERPRQAPPWEPRARVVLPPALAVAMTGGDRFLAANLQAIRGLVVATHLDSPAQKGQFAQLMASANRLNPAHEDSYYLSQSLLPWDGLVGINQRIQARAMAARPWDWLPAFFRGFNRYYFGKEPGQAARFMRAAAQRSPGNRQALLATAARWKALGQDPKEALEVIRVMARSTRSGALKRRLRARIRQLEGLIRLRAAAAAFQERTGAPPKSLDALVGYGGLDRLPDDPLGEGYLLSEQGKVRITPPRSLRQEPHLPASMR